MTLSELLANLRYGIDEAPAAPLPGASEYERGRFAGGADEREWLRGLLDDYSRQEAARAGATAHGRAVAQMAARERARTGLVTGRARTFARSTVAALGRLPMLGR